MEARRPTKPRAKKVRNDASLTCTVRRVHKLMVKRVRARFPESEGGFEEWMALRLFADGLIETAGDLAREFGIATGATTRLIDSLERRGFVERDRKDGDRRVVLLRLTDLGRAHFGSKLPDLRACWDEALAGWPSSEVDQLVTLLAKLERSLGGPAVE